MTDTETILATKVPTVQAGVTDQEKAMMAGILASEVVIENLGANEKTPAIDGGEGTTTRLTPETLPEEMIAGTVPRKSHLV